MHDELTKSDIQKMEEEIRYRRCELRPELLEEVKRTRAFGDLSENFEYKEAKRAKNRNDSRIRYLEAMIKTAKVISDESKADEVGLFDKVTVRMANGKELCLQIVTTLRTDPLHGIVSKESPFGKAIMGLHVGESGTVHMENGNSYDVTILAIEKAGDDGSIPIRMY